MKDVKIFISCHKSSFVPKCKNFIPVQAGAELAETFFPGMRHDNEGEHISEKNKTYCELTVQYWAWKNVKAEYYGFFHYRRYLSFQTEYPIGENGGIGKRYPLPYKEVSDIKEDLTVFQYEEKRIQEIISRYDVVSLIRERSNFTAYEQYCQFHFQSDLDRILEILKEMYPDYEDAADTYMNSKELYFMNMYLMKAEYFYAYMEWLFPLLEEFERRTDHSSYSESEQRAAAYLAERMFGIYFTGLKSRKVCRLCELSYVVFGNTEPDAAVWPVFANNQVPVVLASNRGFVPYLAVMLQSVLECSSDGYNYDVLILHRDIEQELQDLIKRMGKGRSNVSIRFCDCTNCVKNIPFRVHHHFSVETFYRYFILDLLKGYEKVLYLDSDIVVKQDVAKLYQEDVNGFFMAAVKDMDVIGAYKSDKQQEKYLKQELALKNPLEYFQAGVLVMNLEEMKKNLNSDKMAEVTLKRDWQMVDQDVLNILCEGKIKFLSQKWNVLMNWKNCGCSRMDRMKHAPYSLLCEYQEARKDPYVIHYAGGWKPWNTPCCDFGEVFWDYAKKTPFYETILCENHSALAYGVVARGADGKRTFKLWSTKIKLVLDMKKLNRLLPAGSRRRVVARALFKKFL